MEELNMNEHAAKPQTCEPASNNDPYFGVIRVQS